MIGSPQSFVVREECEKAAWQHGFRRKLAEADGWAGFASTTVPGTIHLASKGAQGPWFLALDHQGVIEELALPSVEIPGPGLVRYAFGTLRELYRVMPRIYQLAASLPDAPLQEFELKVKHLPTKTEAERLVVQRIGQGIFRESLIEYWQCRCPLTGITDEALLRASHIVPWKDCSSDAKRLDVHNGFLLSALWDAAFDRGLVTFSDEGTPIFSPDLSDSGRSALTWQIPMQITEKHKVNLAWHRENLFVSGAT